MIGLRLKAVRSNMLVLFIVKEVLYIPMIACQKKNKYVIHLLVFYIKIVITIYQVCM
jgi:hypothetical protein